MTVSSVTKTQRAKDAACCTPITKAPLMQREADDLAPVLAALGDPVRLRLLSLVAAEGEVCSCNLEAPLVTMSAVWTRFRD